MGVATFRPALSEADLRTLVAGEHVEDRALVAHRLCRRVDMAELTGEERKAAEDIVRIIARDAADMVRRALAVTLKNSPHLPRDVALTLARDVEAVAAPVLENSPAFSDADLVELLDAVAPSLQVAIARREELSPAVTDVIALKADAPVVETALRNPGARFSFKGYGAVTLRFDDSRPVLEALIDRSELPATLVERMVASVTGELFDRLVEKHALPPQLAIDLATRTRERATVDLAAQAGLQADHRRFVQQLQLNGRLTCSLILRALCLGHVRFVEHALAELAGVEHQKAWLLVHDAGGRGLQALYDRTGLPLAQYAAFRLAVDVLHETEFDGGPADRDRFARRLIQRILTAQNAKAFSQDDLAYLLEKIDASAAAEADAEGVQAA